MSQHNTSATYDPQSYMNMLSSFQPVSPLSTDFLTDFNQELMNDFKDLNSYGLISDQLSGRSGAPNVSGVDLDDYGNQSMNHGGPSFNINHNDVSSSRMEDTQLYLGGGGGSGNGGRFGVQSTNSSGQEGDVSTYNLPLDTSNAPRESIAEFRGFMGDYRARQQQEQMKKAAELELQQKQAQVQYEMEQLKKKNDALELARLREAEQTRQRMELEQLRLKQIELEKQQQQLKQHQQLKQSFNNSSSLYNTMGRSENNGINDFNNTVIYRQQQPQQPIPSSTNPLNFDPSISLNSLNASKANIEMDSGSFYGLNQQQQLKYQQLQQPRQPQTQTQTQQLNKSLSDSKTRFNYSTIVNNLITAEDSLIYSPETYDPMLSTNTAPTIQQQNNSNNITAIHQTQTTQTHGVTGAGVTPLSPSQPMTPSTLFEERTYALGTLSGNGTPPQFHDPPTQLQYYDQSTYNSRPQVQQPQPPVTVQHSHIQNHGQIPPTPHPAVVTPGTSVINNVSTNASNINSPYISTLLHQFDNQMPPATPFQQPTINNNGQQQQQPQYTRSTVLNYTPQTTDLETDNYKRLLEKFHNMNLSAPVSFDISNVSQNNTLPLNQNHIEQPTVDQQQQQQQQQLPFIIVEPEIVFQDCDKDWTMEKELLITNPHPYPITILSHVMQGLSPQCFKLRIPDRYMDMLLEIKPFSKLELSVEYSPTLPPKDRVENSASLQLFCQIGNQQQQGDVAIVTVQLFGNCIASNNSNQQQQLYNFNICDLGECNGPVFTPLECKLDNYINGHQIDIQTFGEGFSVIPTPNSDGKSVIISYNPPDSFKTQGKAIVFDRTTGKKKLIQLLATVKLEKSSYQQQQQSTNGKKKLVLKDFVQDDDSEEEEEKIVTKPKSSKKKQSSQTVAIKLASKLEMGEPLELYLPESVLKDGIELSPNYNQYQLPIKYFGKSSCKLDIISTLPNVFNVTPTQFTLTNSTPQDSIQLSIKYVSTATTASTSSLPYGFILISSPTSNDAVKLNIKLIGEKEMKEKLKQLQREEEEEEEEEIQRIPRQELNSSSTTPSPPSSPTQNNTLKPSTSIVFNEDNGSNTNNDKTSAMATSQVKKGGLLLYCSKRIITFGGIRLGSSKSQIITLSSNSDTALHINASIIGKKDKQIQLSSNSILINPKSSVDLMIDYTPLFATTYTSVLNLCLQDKSSFFIPIRGYGGMAKMRVISPFSTDQQGRSIIYVNSQTNGNGYSTVFQIKNDGQRSGFVRLLANYPNGNIEIQPKGVVIGIGEKQEFQVRITPDLNSSLINPLVGSQGIIKLYYGDEIARKRRRSAKRLVGLPDETPRKIQDNYSSFSIFDEDFLYENRYRNDEEEEEVVVVQDEQEEEEMLMAYANKENNIKNDDSFNRHELELFDENISSFILIPMVGRPEIESNVNITTTSSNNNTTASTLPPNSIFNTNTQRMRQEEDEEQIMRTNYLQQSTLNQPTQVPQGTFNTPSTLSTTSNNIDFTPYNNQSLYNTIPVNWSNVKPPRTDVNNYQNNINQVTPVSYANFQQQQPTPITSKTTTTNNSTNTNLNKTNQQPQQSSTSTTTSKNNLNPTELNTKDLFNSNINVSVNGKQQQQQPTLQNPQKSQNQQQPTTASVNPNTSFNTKSNQTMPTMNHFSNSIFNPSTPVNFGKTTSDFFAKSFIKSTNAQNEKKNQGKSTLQPTPPTPKEHEVEEEDDSLRVSQSSRDYLSSNVSTPNLSPNHTPLRFTQYQPTSSSKSDQQHQPHFMNQSGFSNHHQEEEQEEEQIHQDNVEDQFNPFDHQQHDEDQDPNESVPPPIYDDSSKMNRNLFNSEVIYNNRSSPQTQQNQLLSQSLFNPSPKITRSPTVPQYYYPAPEVDEGSMVMDPTFMYAQEDTVFFGNVAKNQTSSTKIGLSNAWTEPITVELSDMNPPFENSYRTVVLEPRKITRVPIYFTPTQRGQFTQQLRITSLPNDSLENVLYCFVELQGESI